MKWRAMAIAAALFSFLLFPATGPADQLDLWIGFSGVQTKETPGGKLRYVNVVVGSNETPQSAQGWVFATYLQGSSGKIDDDCFALIEVPTKVKPAVSLLRFQVLYGSSQSPKLPPPVEYRLKAWLTGAPDGQGSSGNNLNEFTFTFPAGGETPQCVKLK